MQRRIHRLFKCCSMRIIRRQCRKSLDTAWGVAFNCSRHAVPTIPSAACACAVGPLHRCLRWRAMVCMCVQCGIVVTNPPTVTAVNGAKARRAAAHGHGCPHDRWGGHSEHRADAPRTRCADAHECPVRPSALRRGSRWSGGRRILLPRLRNLSLLLDGQTSRHGARDCASGAGGGLPHRRSRRGALHDFFLRPNITRGPPRSFTNA